MKPYPSYIIIGTGKDNVNIPEDVYKRFLERKISVVTVPTVNILLISSRHVVHLMSVLRMECK